MRQGPIHRNTFGLRRDSPVQKASAALRPCGGYAFRARQSGELTACTTPPHPRDPFPHNLETMLTMCLFLTKTREARASEGPADMLQGISITARCDLECIIELFNLTYSYSISTPAQFCAGAIFLINCLSTP